MQLGWLPLAVTRSNGELILEHRFGTLSKAQLVNVPSNRHHHFCLDLRTSALGAWGVSCKLVLREMRAKIFAAHTLP